MATESSFQRSPDDDDDPAFSSSPKCFNESIVVKRIFFGLFEQKSSLATSTPVLFADNTPYSHGLIFMFDLDTSEKLPFANIQSYRWVKFILSRLTKLCFQNRKTGQRFRLLCIGSERPNVSMHTR
jgi:hypothetical protein